MPKRKAPQSQEALSKKQKQDAEKQQEQERREENTKKFVEQGINFITQELEAQATLETCRSLKKDGVNNDPSAKLIDSLMPKCHNMISKLNDNLLQLCRAVDPNPEILTLLLKVNANPNATAADGMTSLMSASYKGHEQVVGALLEANANPNAPGPYGMTSLIFASQNGHAEVVGELLKAQANPNAAAADGMTSLMAASEHGHNGVVLEIVQHLSEAAANGTLDLRGQIRGASGPAAAKAIVDSNSQLTTVDLRDNGISPEDAKSCIETLYYGGVSELGIDHSSTTGAQFNSEHKESLMGILHAANAWDEDNLVDLIADYAGMAFIE